MTKSLLNVKMKLWQLGLTVCLLFQGCYQTGSFTPSEIFGAWTRNHDGITETIVFMPDFRFQQTVQTPDGKLWERNNTWKIGGSLIFVTNLLKTYDVETKMIINPPKELNPVGITMSIVAKEGQRLSLGELDPYEFTKKAEK